MSDLFRYTGNVPAMGNSTVLLADISGSMAGTPYARLKEALQSIWPESKATLFAFHSEVVPVEHPDQLPQPTGGTALHLALAQAALLSPSKVIVISDGQPDNKAAALAMAQEIPGVIDVIFCGSESDVDAIDFMGQLTRLGGGQVVLRDLHDARALLAPAIQELLQLEGPIAL